MNSDHALYLGCVEALFCAFAIIALLVRRQWSNYWALISFLGVHALSNIVELVLLYGAERRVERLVIYRLYFYVYWFSYAVESLLALLIVYQLFQLAMAPLPGLKHLGAVLFRWATVVSLVLAIGSAFTPNATLDSALIAGLSQMQRSQSILTLCLLLFVCFAVRPMGLLANSRIFGVSLGLGIVATAHLVQVSTYAAKVRMFAHYDLLNGMAICLALLIWTAYFALPEPKRRMIVLPTTSPFHRWNQIAMALGDEPGFVAVGGMPPEILAPAEIEVMRRASLKMVHVFPKSVNG